MRSPRPRTTSTSSPHSSAARSTDHSASRASSSGQPTVCASSHSRSAAPASSTWRIEPEGQRGVGARQRRDVLVAAGRGVGADRVDGHDVRAGSLRLAHERPLVEVRGQQVGAPEDDQPRLDDRLRLEADGAAVDRAHRGRRGGGADRGAQPRGAEVGEQARAHRPALDVAHGAGEVVGQDRLGPSRSSVACSPAATRAIASSQVARRNEPGRRPWGRRAPAGSQPVGAVDGVEVVVDLAAERAARERVVAVAADARPPCRPRR